MMWKNLHKSFILIALSAITLNSFGGAWTKTKGKYYFQTSYSYMKYRSIFYEGSTAYLDRQIFDYTIQAYYEYGLNDELTFISVLPFKSVGTLGQTNFEQANINTLLPFPGADPLSEDKLEAFSNMQFGIKYALPSGKYVKAIQAKLYTPSRAYNHEAGLRTGFNAWSFHPSFIISRGYNKSYFSGDFGLRFQSNGHSHYYTMDLEYGRRFEFIKGKTTWIAVVINEFNPIIEKDIIDGREVLTSLFRNNTSWLAPGSKIAHYINDKTAINFSMFGAFKANYQGHFPTMTLGVSWEN